ncbi:MAG: glycosyltransferase family 4 protein [Calditrichaeota bacterium]|nr:MAG: glycosyltransferase family 4 protein [Calditrichota bacterium]
MPLKILHLISQRPDSTGSGIYLQAVLQQAAAKKHHNFLMAGIQKNQFPDLSFIDSNQCTFLQFEDDIKFPIVGMSDVMPYASTRFSDLNAAQLAEYEAGFMAKLDDVVQHFQPDLIHSHHLWILSALSRRRFPELPIVTSCHGTDVRQFQNCPHLAKRVQSACQKLDAVFALSHAQKQEIIEIYNIRETKIHVVGAGFNNLLFTQKTKPEPAPVRIVYAGKLSNSKGVPWLLRALKKINSPAWQLHLIGGGSGAEKEKCLRLAKNLGGKVKVYGILPQNELARVMQQSHIFVLPSFFEGLPLVLLEALACGCRIIATKLPGVEEVFGKLDADFIRLVPIPRLQFIDKPFAEDEIKFEKNLQTALHKSIQDAAENPQLDLSPYQSYLDRFTWRHVFHKIESKYYETHASRTQGNRG